MEDADYRIEDITSVPNLDTNLLPIYQQYQQTLATIGIWDYLSIRGDFDLAAAFSKLFWPDFIEVDGCVLLREQYAPQNFSDWMQHFNGNRQEVEAMINHFHIVHMFLNSPQDVEYPDRLYDYLVNILLVTWKHALTSAFPNKQFVFTVRDGFGGGPEISFHQAA